MAISRRKSRELALQILYQADFIKQSIKDALPFFIAHFNFHKELDEFTIDIVRGVDEYRSEIDRRISACSEHWALERMSPVDRNIIRIAVFEILRCDDIPSKVSINEAIELGKKFGTEKSAVFINGILDNIYHSQKQ